ncbi:hypothetical protein BH23GEM10_BH23GEM10_03760 [soil metagenome]
MLGDSVRRRQPGGRGAPAARGRKSGGSNRFEGWKPFLIALPLALLVPAAIGYLVAVFVLFPPTDASEGGIAVPRLIGRSVSDAQRDLATAGLGELEISQQPHPSAPAGQVVAQSPLPGQQQRYRTGVRVALSSGPPRAVVPDVVGFSAERAESLLRRAGFDVDVVRQDDRAPAGRVLRTSPARGQESTLPSRVTVVVSEGSAAVDTVVPPALPQDTLAVVARPATDR